MLSHARRLYSVRPVKATNRKLYAAAAKDEGKRRPLSAQGCKRIIPQTHVHHAAELADSSPHMSTHHQPLVMVWKLHSTYTLDIRSEAAVCALGLELTPIV
jgi:predicted signal transduction protein with EAL and GGDEF domain